MIWERKNPRLGGLSLEGQYLRNLLSHAWYVGGSIVDRLIAIDIAVSYLEVEITARVATHPSLVVYGRSLTSKVRKWQQVTLVAF